MKVIDLLNKIANGEERDLTTYFIFDKEKYNFYQFSKEYAIDINSLNWEIELEEDKKIEKLELYTFSSGNLEMLIELLNDLNREHVNKINEIIDYLNKENK